MAADFLLCSRQSLLVAAKRKGIMTMEKDAYGWQDDDDDPANSDDDMFDYYRERLRRRIACALIEPEDTLWQRATALVRQSD